MEKKKKTLNELRQVKTYGYQNPTSNKNKKMDNHIKILLEECRDIIEEKGESCPIYVSYEKKTYNITREEIQKISKLLYLLDSIEYLPDYTK
jgi:hypothetical protein